MGRKGIFLTKSIIYESYEVQITKCITVSGELHKPAENVKCATSVQNVIEIYLFVSEMQHVESKGHDPSFTSCHDVLA